MNSVKRKSLRGRKKKSLAVRNAKAFSEKYIVVYT